MPRDEFLREAQDRGFIHQCTDLEALDALMRQEPINAYIGFDCTADSLHVGSLVSIMLLRLLQKHGHRPVVVLGGGTTRIGDPSGRDESRQLLTDEAIAANMRGIERAFQPYLQTGKRRTDALFVNNADWLDGLGYIPLLREIGTHFTINRMLTMDSVRLRLEREQPLTLLEFNYMILQSYDFRELYRRHGVRLQMGGSDQWGNIVAGADLVRRTDGAIVFGLTTPLITTASGTKMGKTAKGAVWLNPERLAPYDYWQFWRNVEDADVGRFLRLFTNLPLNDIARLAALQGAELNAAKKILATEATRLLHGDEAAARAAETARTTFELGGAAEDLPVHEIARALLEERVSVVQLLADAGLCASRGEARRLIANGGARVNDFAVTDEKATIGINDLRDGVAKLSAGRKQHRLIRPV